MATFRQRALDEAAAHTANRYFERGEAVSSYFGENVFDLETMKNYLSAQALQAVLDAREKGTHPQRDVADQIADGVKLWAMERGATHYTHLFQPLTDSTAEKHEAFISFRDGRAVEEFSGEALVQQEPDASSFPNGGLRNTFEARGYSAWDPTSPLFILDGTLCIPSVFVAYTGEALDMKVPHLKSLRALSDAAAVVARLFDPGVKSVGVNVGLEQEYFLVDEALYNARPDLRLSGRTVIGHTSAKDQQLDDHYFGAIPARVSAFMKDFETEAYRLGIRLKTRHNEVAPNQFECAPLYADATTAIDQNMILMVVMQKVAEKHRLRVIFHEKPFGGVNGSGKHCNWSMTTDTGINLLSPGKTPEKNLRFLSFFACVLKGIQDHGFLLMTSVASLNNSYRLGGNEAPPAVMSVFSGSTLSAVMDAIVNGEEITERKEIKSTMDIIGTIPEIIQDNTDRNRTSPFAFTGNRFEFRAVGSSQNAAAAEYVLNTIVAEALREFKKGIDSLEAEGKSRDEAISVMIRRYFTASRPVRFEGNGYSPEWAEEAARRGLKPVRDIPEAYEIYHDPETRRLFTESGVLTEAEIEARYEVLNEIYVKKLQIEARILGDICLNHVLPAAIRYENLLIKGIKGKLEIFGDESLAETETSLLKDISKLCNALSKDVAALVEARKGANSEKDIAARAKRYSSDVRPLMDKVRKSADSLEMLVDDELWPLPKYRELLFF